MKPKLIVVYLLIVLVPLVVVAWLGVVFALNEQAMVAVRFREVLLGRLNDVGASITALLEQRERELMSQPGLSSLSPDEMRKRATSSGMVRQYFVLDPEGNLTYPPPTGELTPAEEDFLERTRAIWANGEIPGPEAELQTVARADNVEVMQQATRRSLSTAKGWHAWYWGSGIRLIFWWRDELGNVVGAELNEMRLMADIVGMLPEAWPDMPAQESPLPDGSIALADSRGAVIYQWGGYAPGEGEAPRAQLALLPPLGSWSLNYYAPGDGVGSAYGRGVLFNVFSGIGVLGLALIGLAVYFYRENTRAVREALQRVTFVNQVSHELKTPLTNIRMYAEMLEEELGDTDEAVRHRLEVIVSESQRLSRLIGNVLTFSRTQRSALTLRKAFGNVDEALRAMLSHFETSLGTRGVRVEFQGGAGREAEFDRDALEQIISNLLSNVEKYVATGDRVAVASQQDGDLITITVADNGPGIPQHLGERIFEPFYRVSDKLTDGVAGAGIGLTIARQLARLHGGDLTLEPSAQGACFKVVLRAPARHWGETP